MTLINLNQVHSQAMMAFRLNVYKVPLKFKPLSEEFFNQSLTTSDVTTGRFNPIFKSGQQNSLRGLQNFRAHSRFERCSIQPEKQTFITHSVRVPTQLYL